MKRILCLMMIFMATIGSVAQGADLKELLVLRANLQEESKTLKSILADTKDILYINTLWDSCAMSTMQIDAYFVMIGIYEAAPVKYRRQEGADYMMKWLTAVKNTHELNVKTLAGMTGLNDPRSNDHILKLKTMYESLLLIIDGETDKLMVLKQGENKRAAQQ